MIYKKHCRLCGALFKSHQPSAVYCPDCRGRKASKVVARDWRQKHSHPCPDCGKLASPHAHYCRRCSRKHFGKNHRGSNCNLWKGGRVYDTYNYVQILKRDHPNATKSGYVYEHRLIWEEANGSLPQGYVIHHLNGIKDDNRLQNLIALPRGRHHYALHLQSLQKHIRDLESRLAQQGFWLIDPHKF